MSTPKPDAERFARWVYDRLVDGDVSSADLIDQLLLCGLCRVKQVREGHGISVVLEWREYPHTEER